MTTNFKNELKVKKAKKTNVRLKMELVKGSYRVNNHIKESWNPASTQVTRKQGQKIGVLHVMVLKRAINIHDLPEKWDTKGEKMVDLHFNNQRTDCCERFPENRWNGEKGSVLYDGEISWFLDFSRLADAHV